MIKPFNSYRKMMSVVVKNLNGEYIIYVKGSDTAILPLLEFS